MAINLAFKPSRLKQIQNFQSMALVPPLLFTIAVGTTIVWTMVAVLPGPTITITMTTVMIPQDLKILVELKVILLLLVVAESLLVVILWTSTMEIAGVAVNLVTIVKQPTLVVVVRVRAGTNCSQRLESLRMLDASPIGIPLDFLHLIV